MTRPNMTRPNITPPKPRGSGPTLAPSLLSHQSRRSPLSPLSASDLFSLCARLQVRRADLAAAVEVESRCVVTRRAAELVYALRRVEQALGRVTAGTFGRCSDCSVAIELCRLLAAPDVAQCLRCQNRLRGALLG